MRKLENQDFAEFEKKAKVRIKKGEISKIISASKIMKGNPSKERVFGRLEAYLATGVLIEIEELEKVFKKYPLTSEQYEHLGTIYCEEGYLEGRIQEPENFPNIGKRLLLTPYFFEKAQEEEKRNTTKL